MRACIWACICAAPIPVSRPACAQSSCPPRPVTTNTITGQLALELENSFAILDTASTAHHDPRLHSTALGQHGNHLVVVVATDVRAPGYHAERDGALERLTTLKPRASRRTLGADKGYDESSFVEGVRAAGFTPHVAQNIHRWRKRSAIDERITRHDGYAVSQRKRKQVEESFR